MERADPIVRNLSEDEKLALKKKKPQLGGAGNVPDSSMPVLAGGTGEKPGPLIGKTFSTDISGDGISESQRAKMSRITATNMRDQYRMAKQSGASPEDLKGILGGIAQNESVAGGYERAQRGVALRPQTAEEHAASVANLKAQQEAHFAQQLANPQPQGDTAYQAGLSVLPKNLRNPKFTDPVDQANAYQFVRDVGQNNLGMNAGRQAVRGADGELQGFSSPADRLKAQGADQRAEAMAKLGAPRQDYAPYDPQAAKAYVERDQQGYEDAQRTSRQAIDSIREREALSRKVQAAPAQVALAGANQAIATSGAATEQATTAEQMARIQREAMLGTTGDTKIPPQIQAQISQADNAAKESLRATEQATRARDLSLDNPDPTWQRAVSILANLPTRINTLKSPTVLPTPENIAQAEVTDQHLSELEAMLPQLSPYQRQSVLQKIRDSVGDETNLENRPAIEQATKASFLNLTNPLALGQAIMGQNQQTDPRAAAIKRAQSRINKFRAMR